MKLPTFRRNRAPCEIVLRVPAGQRLRAVPNEVLNPFCSEDSWISLASSLGQMTNEPIVRRTKAPEASELDFDGMGALKDDDDEGKSKSAETEAEPIRVDSTPLSRVLDGLRPKGCVLVPADGYRFLERLPGFQWRDGLGCFLLAGSSRSNKGRPLGFGSDVVDFLAVQSLEEPQNATNRNRCASPAKTGHCK